VFLQLGRDTMYLPA